MSRCVSISIYICIKLTAWFQTVCAAYSSVLKALQYLSSRHHQLLLLFLQILTQVTNSIVPCSVLFYFAIYPVQKTRDLCPSVLCNRRSPSSSLLPKPHLRSITSAFITPPPTTHAQTQIRALHSPHPSTPCVRCHEQQASVSALQSLAAPTPVYNPNPSPNSYHEFLRSLLLPRGYSA